MDITNYELAPEGEGHNASLIKVAGQCYRAGASYDDTLEHLEAQYDPERLDYRTAPKRAVAKVWENEGKVPEKTEEGHTPDMQEEMLLRFRRTPAQGVKEASPHKTNIKPISIIANLFNKEDIVNIQFSGMESGTLVKVKDMRTDPTLNGDAGNLGEYKFLNPSIFRKLEGCVNPNDSDKEKLVTRCNANVKERKFMILEMDAEDEAKVERFNTFALELSRFCPLVLAVDTGNKSIHYWFDKSKASKPQATAMFNMACQHGADKQMGVLSQIARMPNVSAAKEGRSRQIVLYYDPQREKCPTDMEWDVKGFEDYIISAKAMEVYFAGGNSYYIENNNKTWISLPRGALTKHLAKHNIRENRLEGESLSPSELFITDIEMDYSVDAVLPGAAGKHAGYYCENGFSALITKSPTLIKPRKGDWSTLNNIFRWQLAPDAIQIDILFTLLSAAVKMFRNGGKREALHGPLQMIHLIGDHNSFKTVMIMFIFPLLFGGRSAKADPLFKEGDSGFNSEMFSSEFLFLDDTDVMHSDHRSRTRNGHIMKDLTVGHGQAFHGKGKDKVNIKPWWVIVRSMNMEPETLASLPTGEDGTFDKYITLLCQSMVGGPVDMTKPGWFIPLKKKLISEIPAFLHFLLYEYVAPEGALDPDGRYPVASYKNPEITKMVNEGSTEQSVYNHINKSQIFEQGFDDYPPEWWQGSASELYDVLCETGSKNMQMRFRKMCPTPVVLSAQLRLLEKQYPQQVLYSARTKVEIKKLRGSYFWRIMPPTTIEADDCF